MPRLLRAPQEGSNQLSACDHHVLAGIEHQEKPACLQRYTQRLDDRLAWLLAKTEYGRH